MLINKYTPYNSLYELTLKCNMNCIHCGSSAGISRKKELTREKWKNVTKELSDMGGKFITLLGGEPLIRKDWYEISEDIIDNGMKLTIISNGLLINEKNIKKIRKLNPYTIAISLDGGTPETHDSIRRFKGSFDKCLDSIRLLKNAGINTSIVTTLNKNNLKDLPKIRDLIVNRDIAWQIQIAVPIGRFPREVMLSRKEFYSAAIFIAACRQKYSMKKLPVMGAHCFGYFSKKIPNINIIPTWRGCQAGLTILGIQSNGDVKGCLSLPDEFKEGNLLEKSLKEIWNGEDFSSYNRQFKKSQLNGECKECKYAKKCRGGCTSVSTATTGKKNSDPYCFNLIEREFKMLQ
jgi:radical SAM protein with 4Fe4S-binding SPASM domain